MNPSENSRNVNQDSTQSQRETRDLEAGEEQATATTSGDVLDSSQRASFPYIAGVPSVEASSSQIREDFDPDAPSQHILNSKTIDLILFLLLKYRRKQQTCKAEILYMVIRGYEDYFPAIFTKASDCLRLTFGLEVIERNPRVHSYSLVNALGLTYDGMHHGFLGVPKIGLVIIVLCIIFIEDNCASEQELWRILNNMGLYAGRDHFIYGDPGVLITEHFVQEGYLECRQVPGSDPPTREYLWGPRAHAETTKMKVLKHFASIVKQDPRSYPTRYADALKDEIDRV
ncbi:melanoma-associated antigen 11-like [Mus pahari]|uniref:melanoma-associated antigen 11-like n=1 Tax=Mus pahari TaxID=10093 RepID=UPI000A304CEF|nr:melanoma-associated antigen 11-like [Mus pahari]XP_021044280.1 melanoma-associated antigen 11-like [Mus pahari]XP_021044281.1 melanoma-associated antigen 11-like [Mus pahari]